MTRLFWDCFAGIAGNMAVASLLDLGADQLKVEEAVGRIPFPEGPIRLIFERRMKNGIDAFYFNTADDERIDGHGQDQPHHHPHGKGHSHDHSHSHDHDQDRHPGSEASEPARIAKSPRKGGGATRSGFAHPSGAVHPFLQKPPSHEHFHRGFTEIVSLLEAARLPKRVTDLSIECFKALGEVEARVHGTTLEKIHFHEVGARDSIADIVGTAVCIEDLGITSVMVSPIHVGSGFTDCSHGKIPVPAPATAALLQGYEVFSLSDIEGELTTPTGAALLKGLGAVSSPDRNYSILKVGYGAGSKEFGVPNVLRAILVSETSKGPSREQVSVLETNLDNCSGELMGFFIERVMEAGALDVTVLHAQMKKNRPGLVVSVMARPEDARKLENLMFRELPTLGIRRNTVTRSVLARAETIVDTPLGKLRGKKILEEGGGRREVVEYEEQKRLALETGEPLRRIQERIREPGPERMERKKK